MDWPTAGAIAAFLTFILLPVAWVLTLSETGGVILGGIVWFITWPCHRERSKCYHFTLDDIPSGRLIHSRPPLCYQDEGIVQNGKENCWNGTLGKMFPQVWQDSPRRVNRPRSLSPSCDYVCTNAETVMAFVFYTMSPVLNYDSSDYSISITDDGYRYGSTYIKYQPLQGNTMVMHLDGNIHENPQLTKGDVIGLLEGYPPWYREAVRLDHGPSIPHPTSSSADLQYRAGWTVALGLSDLGALPTACHDHACIQKSFFRALVITRDVLLAGFPNDPSIRIVSGSLQYMWNAKTNSGADVRFTLSMIPHLSGSQERYAMRLYNGPPNVSLSADDIQNPEKLKTLEI